MIKKIDNDNRVVIRLTDEENEKLNLKIKKLISDLHSKGITINFISRSQMCKSLILKNLDTVDK